MDIETQKAISEREILREWVSHPGTKIIANKLNRVARGAILKQTRLSPFTHADEIVKCQQLRYVLNILIPQIIEDIANYDESAYTKQIEGVKRWNVLTWLKGILCK